MSFDWRQPLFREDGEQDNDLVQQYHDLLIGGFFKSTESIVFEKTHDTAGWPTQLLLHALQFLKRPLHRLEPKHQEKVLLDSFPKSLVTYPDVADDIIEELRLMWRYFSREYRWRHAMSCHDALTDSYVHQLNAALSDPTNFSYSKKAYLIPDLYQQEQAPAESEFVTVYVKRSDAGRRRWACQETPDCMTEIFGSNFWKEQAASQSEQRKQANRDRHRRLTQKLRKKKPK